MGQARGRVGPPLSSAHGVTGCTVPTCAPGEKAGGGTQSRPQAGPPPSAWWTASGRTARGPPDLSPLAGPGSSGSLTQRGPGQGSRGTSAWTSRPPQMPQPTADRTPQGTTGEHCPEGSVPPWLCCWLLGGVGAQAAQTMVLGDVCQWVPHPRTKLHQGFPILVPASCGPSPLPVSGQMRGRQTGEQPRPGDPRGASLGVLPAGSAPLHACSSLLGFQADPQLPGPWRGVQALRQLPLFHAPTQGTCPQGQGCSDLPAGEGGRLDPGRRPRTPGPHLSLGLGAGRVL